MVYRILRHTARDRLVWRTLRAVSFTNWTSWSIILNLAQLGDGYLTTLPTGPPPWRLQGLGTVWSSSLGPWIKIVMTETAITTGTMAMCLEGAELSLHFKSLAQKAHILSGAQACVFDPTIPRDAGKPLLIPELT